ncbi:MAG TPA: peptidoglycan bridge formation glycyltransferase FemA/FemB family protein [Bacteroidales bacterium]|nr:peptidoglycan bridge formation glycyltransferase FemA/FemB family protein [Bacteroidales bacterium]
MIETVTDINKNQWEELLANSPYASVFQSISFFDFLNSLSFLKGFVFGVLENEKLVGVVSGYIVKEGNELKGYFSRRAIIHGGLLLAPECSELALETLLQFTISRLRKKVIYVEIRNYRDYSRYKDIFDKNGFSYFEHLNFHIQTPDKDTVFSQLNTTKRRDVRISIKNGAELVDNPTIEQIREYYSLLDDLYSTKIKLPLFPLEFFEKLYLTDFGKFFLLSYQEKIIGGSVCVELQNEVLYEMFVCGLDREYKNIYASTLATWFAIEYASNNKIKHFDMMGAGKPDEGYGVREFKSKFGGEVVEYGRFKFIVNSILYNIGIIGVKFLRRK